MHNIGFFINMNYINKREYCVVWKITRDAHNNHINVNSIRKKQDLGFSPLKRCIISKFVGRELARYEYAENWQDMNIVLSCGKMV